MHILRRGNLAQKLSLVSGLILFAFAATHFLNHALGLVQIEAMHEVQQWRWTITRSWPGSIILGAALLTHIVFGLIKLARRTTLRLPLWELVQIGLGLIIPFLLFPHIVNTRVAGSLFGVEDNYLYELARLWPGSALIQSLLLLIVWAHGCLGIHYWLRLDGRYRKLQPLLLFLAILVPLAALAGFMVSGRAVAALMEDPAMAARIKEITHWPAPINEDLLASYRLLVRAVFAACLVLAAAYMAWRSFILLAAPKAVITYSGGPTIQTAFGPSLLEISRANGIPHAAVCGGRARCSTCRVRIDHRRARQYTPRLSDPPALFPDGHPAPAPSHDRTGSGKHD
jgi:adenylate cyclase